MGVDIILYQETFFFGGGGIHVRSVCFIFSEVLFSPARYVRAACVADADTALGAKSTWRQ